ncbi:MAG: hypothetical protein H6677_03595 [Candidatus Obscuribacterales bacterium]|nr:hypothetical protein [Candidatus Obscuribacterales bacterium]
MSAKSSPAFLISASAAFMTMLALSSEAPASAQAVTREYQNTFEAGVTYFKKGDYKTASGYLRRAVNGAYRSNASAYYWLASSLLKENRIDEAMIAFAQAYSISPHSEVGHNSMQTLHYYKTRIKESETLRTQIASLVRKSADTTMQRSPAASFDSVNGSGAGSSSGSEPELLVDQEKLRSIKRQLKPVTKHSRPGPSPNQFMAWPMSQQANYVYAGAFQAIEQAQSNVDEAKRELSQAQARSNSLVPAFRAYGETEQKFDQRKDASKQILDKILEPYKNEVESCTNQLNDAVTIKNRAQQALNTPLYYQPYGVPRIYR